MDKSPFEWNVPPEFQHVMLELILGLSVALPMEDVRLIETLASRCARAEAKVREYEERMKGRVLVPVKLGYINPNGRVDKRSRHIARTKAYMEEGVTHAFALENLQRLIDKEDTNA